MQRPECHASGDGARCALDESPDHAGEADEDQHVHETGGDLEAEPENGPGDDEDDSKPDESLHYGLRCEPRVRPGFRRA